MNRRDMFVSLALLAAPFRNLQSSTAHIEIPFGSVSLIKLIANPGVFDGRRLNLIGYLANNGVDRAVGLYISEFDGKNFIMPNSIDLRIEESTVRNHLGRCVTLTGTFHAPPAQNPIYNGYVDNILGLNAWEVGDGGRAGGALDRNHPKTNE